MHCRIACAITLVGGLIGQIQLHAENELKEPVRLRVGETVIDAGAQWGHASPCVEDLDGDGVPELIVGDFSGTFQIYKRASEENALEHEIAGKIQANGQDAAVRIYCCIGGQPRFLDLNGDGIRDFISNSYDPGTCFYFEGQGTQEFAAPVELVDKDGVPVRSTVVQDEEVQSFGSFYAPVDWDADADSDLLIGTFDGHLKLRLNEGTATEYVFADENIDVEADGQLLKVEAHCCPVAADWDGDGLWDILSGSDDGSVTWFRNIGTSTEPKFAVGEELVKPHTDSGTSGYEIAHLNGEEFVPGIRSQIDVVDYNNDGKLDLLLGDFCTAYEFRNNLSSDEQKQIEEVTKRIESSNKKIREAMEVLREEIYRDFPGDKRFTEGADQEWQKRYQQVKDSELFKNYYEKHEPEFVETLRPFLKRTQSSGDKLYNLPVSHGFVWFFARK